MKWFLKFIFLQILPVMLGVYLAFFLSDWSNDKAKMEQKITLIKHLKTELINNSEILK